MRGLGRLVLCLIASPAAQATSIRPLVPNRRAESSRRRSVRPPRCRQRGVRDRAELAAFLDGVMAANLRDKHVAGATVAVVKDGALFFAKGYGYADVAHRATVDAERYALSHRVDEQAVHVDRGHAARRAGEARSRRRRQSATSTSRSRRRIPQPITLRHIMTHTPGFEEDGRDLITDDSTRMIPLGGWLATHIPGRVRPPGHVLVVLELRDRARRLHRRSARPACRWTTTSSSTSSRRSA